MEKHTVSASLTDNTKYMSLLEDAPHRLEAANRQLFF